MRRTSNIFTVEYKRLKKLRSEACLLRDVFENHGGFTDFRYVGCRAELIQLLEKLEQRLQLAPLTDGGHEQFLHHGRPLPWHEMHENLADDGRASAVEIRVLCKGLDLP